MFLETYSELNVHVHDKSFRVTENGMFLLLKFDSKNAYQLSQRKGEIDICITEENYADYEYLKKVLSDKINAKRVYWAIILVINVEKGTVRCHVAAVKANAWGFRLHIDYGSDRSDVKKFVSMIIEEQKNFPKMCLEYINNNNCVIDIKKLLCPYKLNIVERIKNSELKNCVENYKSACAKLLYLRPRVLNEYSIIAKEDSFDRDITTLSLHSILSSIKDHATNIKDHMYNGYSGCMNSFLEEFLEGIKTEKNEFYKKVIANEIIKEYALYFLEQNFYNQMNERIRIKPDTNLYEIHMGKNWNKGNRCIRSLYITPRFREGIWENDKSEIRRVGFDYYTIGHLLHAGMVLHKAQGTELVKYKQFDEWKPILYPPDELENDEKQFVQCYLEYVENNIQKLNTIPLLLPQFRYGGLQEKHKYRADFLILNYQDRMNPKKIIVELSRNQVHDNIGEKDAIRRNDFIRKYECALIELRDYELTRMKETFYNRIVHAGYLL